MPERCDWLYFIIFATAIRHAFKEGTSIDKVVIGFILLSLQQQSDTKASGIFISEQLWLALFYYLCNSNPTRHGHLVLEVDGCDWLYFIIFATAIRHSSGWVTISHSVVIGFILLSLQQQSDTRSICLVRIPRLWLALFYYLCNSNPTHDAAGVQRSNGCDWLYFIIFATAIRHNGEPDSERKHVVIGFILLSLQQQSDTPAWREMRIASLWLALFYYLCNSNPTHSIFVNNIRVGCDWLYFIIFATAIRHNKLYWLHF